MHEKSQAQQSHSWHATSGPPDGEGHRNQRAGRTANLTCKSSWPPRSRLHTYPELWEPGLFPTVYISSCASVHRWQLGLLGEQKHWDKNESPEITNSFNFPKHGIMSCKGEGMDKSWKEYEWLKILQRDGCKIWCKVGDELHCFTNGC